MKSKQQLYSALVWIISGISLTIYGVLGLMDLGVPGVEELVSALSKAKGSYIYIAAFTTILIEGLYVIGSFFPGSSMVVILAILSQVGGTLQFFFTILSIFVGWSIAGVINIFLAKRAKDMNKEMRVQDVDVKDMAWATWFPPFRANYEVAQVMDGADTTKVIYSAIRVRLWASLFMSGICLIIPIFININESTNEEGFVTLAIVAIITFIVGGIKMKKYFD